MTKTTTSDRATTAFWQLLEDDEVHDHLRTAAVRLREAGQRVSHLPGSKAVEDKKLYDKLRDAAISLARALKLLGPEPEPPKTKRRVVQVIVLATTAGVVAIVLKQRSAKGTAEAT